jgi:hypothetical protein
MYLSIAEREQARRSQNTESLSHRDNLSSHRSGFFLKEIARNEDKLQEKKYPHKFLINFWQFLSTSILQFFNFSILQFFYDQNHENPLLRKIRLSAY